jgi:hypothetical protein
LEVCQDEFQGLQVYNADSNDKVVHEIPEGKVLRCSDDDEKEVYNPDSVGKGVLQPEIPVESKEQRFCGFPRQAAFILLAVVLLSVIVLALGLGIGFGLRHSS